MIILNLCLDNYKNVNLYSCSLYIYLFKYIYIVLNNIRKMYKSFIIYLKIYTE